MMRSGCSISGQDCLLSLSLSQCKAQFKHDVQHDQTAQQLRSNDLFGGLVASRRESRRVFRLHLSKKQRRRPTSILRHCMSRPSSILVVSVHAQTPQSTFRFPIDPNAKKGERWAGHKQQRGC
ncbi:hypothetical protein BLNAU_5352 [Blattamonas nauphoetae]|uniref:Uncharacterized protein n=1 Tax=Blattamonas nauphoetae TaxID=2049346 RepID=A0ABQ9Y7C4_9EUKA|nr:hypothetical protein BLNAU_5352 [Blattamonas nauphoetae]